MGIKNNTILLYTFRSAILGRGKLAQMNSGYFPKIAHHSSLIPRSSRVKSSTLGIVVDVEIFFSFLFLNLLLKYARYLIIISLV